MKISIGRSCRCRGVERGAVDLIQAVAADEVVQQVDAGGLRAGGRLARDAEAPAGGAAGRAVAGDEVIDEIRDVSARDADAAPLVCRGWCC